MDIFEKATKNKWRFDSVKGKLSVEDLWDLQLKSRSASAADLDGVAITLARALREQEEESFVSKPSTKKNELSGKLELVKYIIQVKLAEAEAKKESVAKAARKQQIMEAIEAKQLDAISSKSLEELQKELASL